MAKTKISKVAKDLNVALPTVIEFLRKKDITIDDNPNTRVEDDIVAVGSLAVYTSENVMPFHNSVLSA